MKGCVRKSGKTHDLGQINILCSFNQHVSNYQTVVLVRGHPHHWHVPIIHQKHTGSTNSMLCPKSGPGLLYVGAACWSLAGPDTRMDWYTSCNWLWSATRPYSTNTGGTDMPSLHDSGDGHLGRSFQRITSIFPFPAAVDPYPLSLLAQHHPEKSHHHEKYIHTILTFIKKMKKKRYFLQMIFFFSCKYF